MPMVTIEPNKPVRFTFRKHERLKSNLTIDSLFLQNRTFRIYPFKLVWMVTEQNKPFNLKAGFSVSKRNFRSAVDRNFFKRRMRECFRLNKNAIYDKLATKNIELSFMLIYVGTETLDFKEFEIKIKQLLIRLTEKAIEF
ncbi:MAG: ribonuclease P protein component [Salinivirgaceae bacterium]